MAHWLKSTREAITAPTRSPFLDLATPLLLFGFGLMWWREMLHIEGWTPDGGTYQSAIDLVLRGRSPYEHFSFPYPPTVAVLGAWLTDILGDEAFRTGFRYMNFLGGCVAVWGSLLLVPWPWLLRFGLAILGTAFIPAVESAIDNDNLSMLSSGMTILPLTMWPYFPVLAGIMLGFGLSLKPIGLGALFLLAAHRPLRGGKKHRVAAGVAGATVAFLVGLSPVWFITSIFQPSATAAQPYWASAVMNVSLFHVLSSYGLTVPPLILLGIVLLLALFFVRRRPLNTTQLLCVASSASLLSLPIVWRHTLLLVSPLPCIAMAVSVRKAWDAVLCNAARDEKNRVLLELLCVACGCLTVFHAYAYGLLAESPAWANGTVLLIPISVIVILTWYVVRSQDAAGWE